MEPVGLAVGVVGLAGVFSVCLDAVERFDAWKNFGDELATLRVRVEVQRLRLDKWGQAVGLKQSSASDVEGHHHPALEDARTSRTVKTLLTTIQDVSIRKGSAFFADNSESVGAGSDLATQGHFGISPTSKRARLKWAFKDKITVRAAVEELAGLIQDLHDLVPPLGDAGAQRGLRLWLLGRHAPNEVFEKAIKEKLNETCQWIFRRQAYLDWATSDFSGCSVKRLWIHGPPGFGKTLLCATLLQHIKATFTTPVASFFFSSDDLESRKDPFVAIRLWLIQLLPEHTVSSRLRRRWKDSQSQVATAADIIGALEEVMKTFSECTFVMDGLDECENGSVADDKSSVTNFLRTIGRVASSTNTRILITSREETAIRQGITNNTGATAVEYRISQEDVRSDIDQYSRFVVGEKLMGRDEKTRKDLCEKMAERCEGQFLWIKLKGCRLHRYKSATLLQDEIQKTPSGLDDLYGRNWDRIGAIQDRDDRERAYAMMRWVSFAARPLTVAELTAALLIDPRCDDMQLDEIPYLIGDDYVDNEILKISASLLEIHEPISETDASDAAAQTVHFTHFTAKQYFILRMAERIDTLTVNERLRSSVQVACNNELAEKCLHYISMPRVWENIGENVHPIYRSFRDYAANAWYEHAAASDHDEVFRQANEFFTGKGSIWKLWRDWFDLQEAVEYEPHQVVDEGPLYYATRFNLIETAKYLIESGHCNVNYIHLRSGLTILQRTILTEKLDMALVLLNARADIFMSGRNGSNALHAASQVGELKLIKSFLDRGADVNTPSDYGLTPLHYACFQGKTAVAQMLLGHGADRSAITSLSEGGWTALHVASYRGHREVAQTLLKDCAYVNCRGRQKMPPLFQSATDGNVEAIKLLLEGGAGDPLVVTFKGLTLIQFAACYGDLNVLQVLLDAGLGSDTDKGPTLLHHACVGGHADVVRMLLAQGANVNAIHDSLGVLHAAAFYGHFDVSELLLNEGLDLNTAMKTPFHIAAGPRSVGMVRFLLKCAAKTSSVDRESQLVPLHATVTRDHSFVAKLLIDQNHAFGVNARTSDGSTPTHLAARKGHLELIQLLIKYGADVSMANDSGNTPLHDAAYSGNEETVRLLIKQEAKHSIISDDCFAAMYNNACSGGIVEIVRFLAHDKSGLEMEVDGGWSPFQLAFRQRRADSVQLLLDAGTTLAAKTTQGRTPLHAAAVSGHTTVVELCLDSRAVINEADVKGNTPLINASYGGHINTIKLLLGRGAKLEAADIERRTSLCVASRQGQTAVAKLLLEMGANKEVTDIDGQTPLLLASQAGNIDVVQLLLAENANREAKNRWGRTPLLDACFLGRTAIVRLLLEKGASMETRDADGRTPLHYAAAWVDAEVFRLLLDNGSPAEESGPDARDRFGQTALSFAVRLQKHAIARMLLSTGKVSLLSEDLFGQTPVSWAKKLGCANIDDFFSIEQEQEAGGNEVQKCAEDKVAETEQGESGTNSSFGLVNNNETQNDAGSGPDQQAVEEWPCTCDVCMLGVPKSMGYRTCELCLASLDSFDICDNCHDLGARCLNPEHILKETTGESTSKLAA